MYFVDVLKVLLRRWYVVLIGLIAIAVAAVAAILVVPTEYQSNGQLLLLLPPQASGDGTPTNPLLNMQDGLIVTSTIIAGNVTSNDTQKALVDAGFKSEYSVSLSPGAGPLLVITASGTDPVDTLATRDEVINRLQAELTKVQSDPGIPSRLIIGASELSMTDEAEVLPGSKIRALAVIAAVGIVLTLLVAFTLDRRPKKARRRSREKPAKDQPTNPPPPKQPDADPGARSGPAPRTAPDVPEPGPRRRSIQLAPRTSARSR